MARPSDEVISTMAASDDVKLRCLGVIARWLRASARSDEDNDLTLARQLIQAMNEAGLVTAINEDLATFIESVTAQARRQGEESARAGVEP